MPNVSFEIEKGSPVAWRTGHGQGKPARRISKFPVLAATMKRPSDVNQAPHKRVNFLGRAVLHRHMARSEPLSLAVDEAPFAVLADGGFPGLELPRILETRLDHPLLVFVDESPASIGGLDRRQTFAE